MAAERSNGGGAAGPGRDRLFLAAVAFALAAAVVLMLGRGIWLDEAYSVWFAGHDLSFGDALRTRWIRDGHPALYPAATWVLQPVLGGSVRTFRLVNLLALPVAAITWRLSRRAPDGERFARLFAMLAASTPFFLLYAAEFRSYSWQLVLSACLIAQLRLVLLAGLDRASAWTLAGTAILLLNLHYVASLVGFVLLGLALLLLASARRWREAAFLLLVGTLGAAGLAISLRALLSATVPLQVNFTSAAQSLPMIALPLVAGFLCNPPATLLAARAAWRGRPDAFAVLLAAALAAVGAIYFAYNLAAHNLVMRFLIAAVPIASALVAHLLAPQPGPVRRWAVPICATAVAVILATSLYGLVNRRWETNVALIQRVRAACPETSVVGLSALSFIPAGTDYTRSIGMEQVFPLAYRLIAATHGFPVTTAYRGRPVTPLVPGACPTLVWLEHRYIARGDDRAMIRAAGLISPTGRVAVRRLEDGPARLLLAVRAVSR